MRFYISFSNYMQKYANKKFVLPLFMMFVVLLTIMQKISTSSPLLKTGTLDMQYSGYNQTIVYSMLDSMGITGRQLYIWLLGVDVLFIFVFTLLLSLMLTVLTRKARLRESFKLINMLPFVRGILDVVENCMILAILLNYPFKLPVIVAISSVVTVSKFIVLAATSILLLGLGVLIAWKAFKTKEIQLK